MGSLLCFFFFSSRRRHTRWPRDWSSDVCSSDLSGLALAIFLPVHFLTLGLAIHGEAPLESFLRWSDQPLVKVAESGLVFLLLVHMLGGVRLLVIENLPWRDEQKALATIAAGLSAVVAFILLARLF